jgi:hypothetical protein
MNAARAFPVPPAPPVAAVLREAADKFLQLLPCKRRTLPAAFFLIDIRVS